MRTDGRTQPQSIRAIILVAAASLLFNGAVLLSQGIRIGGDTPDYVKAAEHLLRGEVAGRRATSHFAFTALLALSMATGLSFPALIALHLAASALAAAALYEMGRFLYGAGAGAVAAGLFILNLDIARWLPYVLTESLYISFVILASYSVWRAGAGRMVWRFLAPLALLVAALLRPNGWLLVPIAVIYWTWLHARQRAWRRMRTLGAVAAIVSLSIATTFWLATSSGQSDAIEADRWLRTGRVIWGYEGWHLPMPPDPSTERGLSAGARYATTHPVASARLAIVRMAVELAAARPYYSRMHNLVVLAAYIPLYFFALWGIGKSRAPLAGMLAAVVLTHLLLVGLTFADYDGRFVLYVMPLISVLAAGGITDLASRLPTGR